MTHQVHSADDILTLVMTKIAPFAERAGMSPDAVAADADLLELGILDSFDIVTILAALEEELEKEPTFPENTNDKFVFSATWLRDGFVSRGHTQD